MSADRYMQLLDYCVANVTGEASEFFDQAVPFGAMVSAYDLLPPSAKCSGLVALAGELVSLGCSVDDGGALVSVAGGAVGPAFLALMLAGATDEIGDTVAALRANAINPAQTFALACLADPRGVGGPVASFLLGALDDWASQPGGDQSLVIETAAAVGRLGAWLACAEVGLNDGPVF